MLGSQLQQADVYTDFQGLAALRREAGQQSPEALEKVAQQFEALFTQMMLKSMRDAGGMEGGLFDNNQTRLYQDMYDKQLSLQLSEGGNGMGLAKVLVRQLRSALPQPAPDGDSAAPRGGYEVPERGMQTFALQVPPLSAADRGEALAAPSPAFASPREFVAGLWPHAEKAAGKLGVDPRALLAQAALETGWGKAVIRRPDGSSSHNLFNIKADHRWGGEQVGKVTLEFRDGVAQKEQASFRAYGSYAQSFDDYCDFLKRHPRYREALEAGADSHLFAERLQEAGYATDPAYASKIKRIVNSDLMADSLAGLKLPAARTLT
jgi:flagellar protein FlgJ